MKRMRILIVALVIWLFLFYNIERLSEPIDITDVAYTFVPLLAALIILVPRLRQIPLRWLLLAPVPVFLVLKAWLKSRVWGESLPLTVTEICCIAVTTLLAYLVSNEVSEFEQAVAHITIGQPGRLDRSYSSGQAEMYREVKRARHYQRPLTIMAVKVVEESYQVAIDRMVQEAQRTMMKQYVLSDLANRLCETLEDYNIVAWTNEHFVLLLPEVKPDQLPDMIVRLCEVVSQQVGVTLQIGTASLPDDGVTFDSLAEKAIQEMNRAQEALDRIPRDSKKRLQTV
jgi:GGDEF domain-containing protein